MIPSDPILNLITLCVGAIKVTTVSNLGHWKGKRDERRKRGPLEVELKDNELIPSDPILNLITLCVGTGAREDRGSLKVTRVLELETMEA